MIVNNFVIDINTNSLIIIRFFSLFIYKQMFNNCLDNYLC